MARIFLSSIELCILYFLLFYGFTHLLEHIGALMFIPCTFCPSDNVHCACGLGAFFSHHISLDCNTNIERKVRASMRGSTSVLPNIDWSLGQNRHGSSIISSSRNIKNVIVFEIFTKNG